MGKKRVRRETCVAGATIDVCVKGSYPHTGSRKPKSKPTSEAVRKNNDRLAEKNLTRLINANFFPGDWHITLTYPEVVAPQEAQHQLKIFIRRLRRAFKKQNKEFKYIAVTEYEHHRIHHHIVMNYIDYPIINNAWKNGFVRSVALDETRNYMKLAQYLIKETSKTFRKPGNATKRRWTASRNLKRPVIKKEWVSIAQLFKDPKALRGYQIDEDSIRHYINPVTGLEHLEYFMVSTDPVPRLKYWRKGKAIKKNETYLRMEDLKEIDRETGEEGEWSLI